MPYDWDIYHGYYAPPLPPLPPLPPPEHNRHAHGEGDGEPRRSSRSDSRSSHERGQSAPPPIGSNPWDVDVSPPRQAAYQSTTSASQRQPPEAWTASLTEAGPARFRLGEDSLPWGAWSVPYGYDPEAHPADDDDSRRPSAPSAGGGVPSGSNVASAAAATSPTEVSTFSPGPSGPGFRPRHDDDPGRVHELSTLGAALMTVDNGFENQWWYQGRREAVDTGDVVGEAVQSPQRFERDSLGWAVAGAASTGPSNHGRNFDGLSSATAASDAVSPLPSFASPASSAATHPTLERSLSTRSDELFFH